MNWIALADAFVALMQWLGLAWLGAGAALSLRESVAAQARGIDQDPGERERRHPEG